MSRYLSRTNLLLAGIVAVAAFLRLYRLDTLPPGLQFDQAFYVFDAIRLLQGEFHIFFAAPGGSEPLYVYLAMVGVSIFGDAALGLKLTSAFIGVLTIPLVFGFARTVFRSSAIALLAAFFTAISVWHIYYGRYGERITLSVLLVILLFWFFWRAVEKRRWRDYVLTGLFLALGAYTNLVGRVFPLALIAITGYMMWTDRPNARTYFKGLIVAGLVSAVLFAPLAVYFVYHPDQFMSHSMQVSIFVPHGSESGDVPTALARNTLRLLGMFFVRGDEGIIRNVPGRPVFDPLLGVLFVAGVIAMTSALVARRVTLVERKRAVFLMVWLLTSMLLSLITDDAPNFDRLEPGIPAIMMLPAWGAVALWERLKTPAMRRVAAGAFGVIAVVSAGLAYRDYFIVLGEDPNLYYAFDTDKVDASEWINRNAQQNQIFLAPLWYQIGTVSLLTRNAPLKSFESRDTIVLPSGAAGRDAVYLFPMEQEKKAQTFQSRLGALATAETLSGSNGIPHLILYRVPARDLPNPQDPLANLARGGPFIQPGSVTAANWANQIALLGYTLSPEGPGGRNLTVTLFLHALAPMTTDYTFSVKDKDTKSRTWGQEDKWPGDNSYATSQWAAGDVIVEKFYPGLSACAPAGTYQVTVEAYNPKTMETLPLVNVDAGAAVLGTFYAGPSGGNRPEDLDPDHAVDLQVGGQLYLSGYTLSADTVQAGKDLSLSLFWKGTGSGATENITVRLGDKQLAAGPVNLPAQGRGLCSLYDLTLPPDVPSGPASIWVNSVKIAQVQVTR